MNNHRKAAYDTNDYEGLSHDLIAINQELCPADLLEAAQLSWDEAVELGAKNGYRNAQATVLAPTGTIGLLMDCDTTGVEPDFALMKFKKLAGGGYEDCKPIYRSCTASAWIRRQSSKRNN